MCLYGLFFFRFEVKNSVLKYLHAFQIHSASAHFKYTTYGPVWIQHKYRKENLVPTSQLDLAHLTSASYLIFYQILCLPTNKYVLGKHRFHLRLCAA
jgi:hypothetical protein